LGPYPINLLRKMLAKGPLHDDTLCRAKNSSRIVPLSSIINAGAATAAKPDVSGPVEHAIRFQSFVRPAANPYRFRGRGTVSIQGNELRLSGKRSRPFWFSRESTVAILFERIRDVTAKGKLVSFVMEPETSGRARDTALFFADPSSALSFASKLPGRLSEKAADKAEFEAQLEDSASRLRVVPALIFLNIVVYALVGLGGAGWTTTDSHALIAWGSNFGPYSTDGQWWRLLTAAFLHGGLMHLLVNMATLYDVGRLCERLYGSRRFAALYLVSGLLGSATSVWWNPQVNSVGASGAIFGVLGAMLVYMLDKRNGIPITVMKTHAVSMGVFITYILVNGLARTGIDNAAHVGGLIGGLVMGYAFARPLARTDSKGTAGLRPIVGPTLSAVMIAVLAANTPNTRGAYELERRFLEDLSWFQAEEKVLMTEMNQLGVRTKQHGMTEAELRPVVAKLTEGWKRVHTRLSAYRLDPASKLRETHDQMTSYVDLRHRAVVLVGEALEAPDQAEAKLAEGTRLMKEGDAVVKRMQDKNKLAKQAPNARAP